MRKNDGIPIIILHFTHDADTVLRAEILLAGIQDFGIGIGGTECLCYLVDIGFQSDYQRFVCQSEAFHLISRTTHYQRFTTPHFMIDDSATVGFQHPDRIFLTIVQTGNTQSLEVNIGKSLHGTVVFGFDGIVELAVILVGEPLLKFG